MSTMHAGCCKKQRLILSYSQRCLIGSTSFGGESACILATILAAEIFSFWSGNKYRWEIKNRGHSQKMCLLNEKRFNISFSLKKYLQKGIVYDKGHTKGLSLFFVKPY